MLPQEREANRYIAKESRLPKNTGRYILQTIPKINSYSNPNIHNNHA
jgi:hypothetical protein